MNLSLIVGKWILIGSISMKSELEFIGEQPKPHGVKNWLNSQTPQLLETMKSTEGLTLTIAPDGTFQEEKIGEPQVEWFDCDGVLSAEVKPFNGYLNVFDSSIYLITDECPLWARDEKLRYNDGDTKISDTLEIYHEKLIRTVSVVTDGMYFDKVVLIYVKATA